MTKITVELELTPAEVQDILNRRFEETRDLAFNRARTKAASKMYSAMNKAVIDGKSVRILTEDEFQNLYADIAHMKD